MRRVVSVIANPQCAVEAARLAAGEPRCGPGNGDWVGEDRDAVAERLLVDLLLDGQVEVLAWPDGGLPDVVSRAPLAWPLDADALEDLRWYLEDYLLAPFGVWEERGPAVQGMLANWGDQVFGSVFGSGPARDAYQRARDRGVEVVFRSADPGLLGLPWELMRDGAAPVALGAGGISRSLPVAGGAGTLDVPGGRLRVLMVISRPAGTQDVGYQLVGRPLLDRLAAVRGEVSLSVLRPPTFGALRQVVMKAADAGEPFHVVHFDGHGVMPGRVHGVMPDSPLGGAVIEGRAGMMVPGAGEGVLVFERPGGGADHVGASKVAAVLAEGRVPVVVLNAAQSGAVGKDLEASVATALLRAGCAAVVAMAYSVYAVAAAEFMAAFYESLFAGQSVGQAVTVGRRRLFAYDGRPSPKGDMPLADWLVPVHYLRKEVRFPQAHTVRPAAAPSLDEALDQIRAAPLEPVSAQDRLSAANGMFVGRDDLFYQLETAAQSQRVVVLAGTGGTGKTELAKGFARWWRDTGGVDDPQLVFWHSFEPGVASFGLDGVITGIGLAVFGTDFARLDVLQRLGAVHQLLGQYRVLLLWDNFEAVREMPDLSGATPPLDEAGCAELKDLLDWVRVHSRSVVIITSRAQEDWLGQVRRIEVGGLNRAETAEYAGDLLAPFPSTRRRRERRSFGELLEWLDGHPLAMRLTLPRLDTADPAELLAELRGAIPLPAAETDAGLGRLSSLAACITYSFVHLSGQTRRLLPAVSLFDGVADAEALAEFSNVAGVPERFTGLTEQDWQGTLHAAAAVGLVARLGDGRYRIHPALPAFLAARWRDEEPDHYDRERTAATEALVTAHAVLGEWLIQQIRVGDAHRALLVIDLERRTLAWLLDYALGHGRWAQARAIAQPLNRYWDIRGRREEAIEWADRARAVLQRPDGTGPALDSPAGALWLFFTFDQANLRLLGGEPYEAERSYRQILAMLKAYPASPRQQERLTVIYQQIGNVAYLTADLDDAQDWYIKSLAIKEELHDRPGMVDSYHQLGNVAYLMGDLDDAQDWYIKSLAIKEELHNRPGMASSYHQLGNVAHQMGDLDLAEDWYRRSLDIEEQLGSRSGMADSYHQLGVVAQNRGRLNEAQDWYIKSLTIKEELHDRPGMASSYHQLGNVSYLMGRLDVAEDWYIKSLTIEEQLGNRPSIAASYHQLGMVAHDHGDLDIAKDWRAKSVAIQKELGNRLGIITGFGQLGRVVDKLGSIDEGLEPMALP